MLLKPDINTSSLQPLTEAECYVPLREEKGGGGGGGGGGAMAAREVSVEQAAINADGSPVVLRAATEGRG